MATTSVQRTPGVTGNRKTWTFSAWFKRGNISVDNDIFGYDGDGSNFIYLRLSSGDTLSFREKLAGSNKCDFTSNQLLRDPAAWYHIVVAVDTNQGTAEDRIKFYLNGTQITSWATDEYYAEDYESQMNESGKEIRIGDVVYYFDGCMSHVVFVDGLQLAASYFGETDSTSGIWKYKQPVVSSYGTNGFYLKMENSSNMDLDSSGNALTFTTTGTLTATKDNPDNNFTTMNSIDNQSANATYSNGNTTITCPAGGYYAPTRSILGMSSGKWYFEVEAGHTDSLIGIVSTSLYADSSAELGHYANDYGLYGSDGKYRTADAQVAYSGDTYTTGDIICVAVDLDNNKLYFRKDDGSWMNSGDPTSGATGTGAISITAPSSTETGNYFAAISGYTTASPVYDVNFGNGYFGTTAVSSTNADDAGIGSFEFDVPTGYYTLCTKNIKAYGG